MASAECKVVLEAIWSDAAKDLDGSELVASLRLRGG